MGRNLGPQDVARLTCRELQLLICLLDAKQRGEPMSRKKLMERMGIKNNSVHWFHQLTMSLADKQLVKLHRGNNTMTPNCEIIFLDNRPVPE